MFKEKFKKIKQTLFCSEKMIENAEGNEEEKL